MKNNAKASLRKAEKELCCAHEHLSSAYIYAENDNTLTEIHAALKSVSSAIGSAQNTLNYFKD